jgi:hypothetical protein
MASRISARRAQGRPMRKLKVAVIDLIGNGENRSLYGYVMFANSASIMPQVVATLCESEGHAVNFIVYTGREDLAREVGTEADVVFISAFTTAAALAYAISAWCRSNGAITILGGPHARSYPEDACRYFDYVFGFTDRETLVDVLRANERQRPLGRYVTAPGQPQSLPGVRERWKFVEKTLQKAPWIKVVPMIGSMGCPYSCSFCIDANVPYQTLPFDVIEEDLRFLLTKFAKPLVAWHDPNFGIKFDQYMGLIERAAPRGAINFIAETSLSILTEPHLRRMRDNGVVALLPGIESWYDLGGKSRVGRTTGSEKLERISEHVNLIQSYIPYLQTNFVIGMDNDQGAEPFELTKRFVDLCPAAFPGYSLLTSYGSAAPLNLEYQEAGRILPFPFPLLNNNLAMNVRPRHYGWVEFYDRLIDVVGHTFSPRAIYRRFASATQRETRWLNLVRGLSQEGLGRLRHHRRVRELLVSDRAFRDYFEGESTVLPQFYVDLIKRSLGSWYERLPEGALWHDHLAYSKRERTQARGELVPKIPPATQAPILWRDGRGVAP